VPTLLGSAIFPPYIVRIILLGGMTCMAFLYTSWRKLFPVTARTGPIIWQEAERFIYWQARINSRKEKSPVHSQKAQALSPEWCYPS
jgi:hypothetical protein